ncbi:MAG: HD domain-containing protein [Oscillospiraceae bacterium]|nr:HD domain-containing protein [Oscillospiraceae bacterium]
MEDKNIRMARAVAEAAAREGGRCYYVGGYVRDRLLGRDNKDIDIEVHGIPVETLERILDSLGERLTMGASFGIMGLRHYDLDIAMPRSETATGRGHKDFAVFVDPFLGPEKAARRRDFTMNAMMEDVLTGEILDFFGGRADMERGILRHVDGASFGEDPLRVLRGAQFAARFGFTIAGETRALSARMDLAALPGERVMGELEKALLKAAAPSVFFEELRLMGQLTRWFPELEALIGVPQNPVFHPEGDVWQHSMQVLDEAAGLRAKAAEPLWFLLAALCHDLGKAAATQEIDGVLHAYDHEKLGLPLVQSFLQRLTREAKLTEYVLNMTQLHMRPNMLVSSGAGVKSYMKMFDLSVCPGDLLLLAEADLMGCLGPDGDREALQRDYAPTRAKLREMLSLFEARMQEPYLMGRDLIEAGFAPGPQFAAVLEETHKLRLAGRPKQEQMKYALAVLRKGKTEAD